MAGSTPPRLALPLLALALAVSAPAAASAGGGRGGGEEVVCDAGGCDDDALSTLALGSAVTRPRSAGTAAKEPKAHMATACSPENLTCGYDNFTTFTVEIKRATNLKGELVNGSLMAYVTFADLAKRGGKYAMNIETMEMLLELNDLCQKLESDTGVKVVVFQSAQPQIFIAFYDADLLAEVPGRPQAHPAELSVIEAVHQRISKLPQATIAKVEGFARGGGHEFTLACDMSFAAKSDKVKFMQMEVSLGIIPCGGGTQRIARRTSKGRAMEIVLGARDFDATTAELYGTINRALDPTKIGPYVDELANRIAQFPSASIQAGKEAVTAAYSGISIEDGLEVEQYQAGQAWAGTPAQQYFQEFSKSGAQADIGVQERFSDFVMELDRSAQRSR